MKKYLLMMAPVLVYMSAGRAGIIDPTNAACSVVSITRYFAVSEIKSNSLFIGVSGTAWFCVSDRTLVTAAHVIDDPPLSANEWTEVELRQQAKEGGPYRLERIPVRLTALIRTSAESLAVLELKRSFTNACLLRISTSLPTNGAPVICIAYPDGQRRCANGVFRGMAGDPYQDKRLAGFGLYETYDKNDRLVLDHGASGAPILDTEGCVASVVSILLTSEIHFLDHTIRTTSSWGSPNTSAIPIEALREFFKTDRR